MTTRRELTQGSLAALIATLLATFQVESSPRQTSDVAFDPQRHETLSIAMVLSAGLRSGDAGLHPVLRFLLCDEPMDPEDAWMLDCCRHELYAVLDRLDAA